MITRGLFNNICLFLQLQMAALFLRFIITAKFYNPAISKNTVAVTPVNSNCIYIGSLGTETTDGINFTRFC